MTNYEETVISTKIQYIWCVMLGNVGMSNYTYVYLL